jgi:surfeit locus 1 family protein
MKNTIMILGQKYKVFEILTILTLFVFLISLGNWQLKRLGEKRNFISTIETNIKNPPISNPQDISLISPYSKIQLSGKFLDQNIFLYGRRSASPEKDGYYLISPFQSSNGDILLVSRGWLPQSMKANLHNFTSPNYESITAIVLPGEQKAMFVPENDQKNNIWFTIDITMANRLFGVLAQNIYLMQIDSDLLPEGVKPLGTNHLSKVRNDHLEYAITWYSLAVFLCLIYYIYNKKAAN